MYQRYKYILLALLTSCTIINYTTVNIMVEKNKRTKNPQFATPYNYKVGEHSCEPKQTEPSKTIPNQGLTVQELVKMHTQGISLSIFKEGLWEMEDFDDSVNPLRKQNFDLSDIDDIRDDLERSQQEVLKQRKEREKEAAIMRKQAIIDEYKAEIEKNEKIKQKEPKQILKEVITKSKD